MPDDLEPVSESAVDWLDWTTQQQALASDPNRSAWVSANAGSGKTHVLTQRVIRLLLSGCRASAILCLTYTKAAAAEMSNRVFERLAEWVTLDDATLSARIEALEGKAPSAATIAEARRLFARALETPGGLKIQTIHAFCEALLHQFPLEANVAGHFSVLDDRTATILLADARRLLLTAAATEGDPVLTGAFETVLSLADDAGLESLLSMIVANRTALQAFFSEAEQHGGTEIVLREALGLEAEETVDHVVAQFWPLAGLNGADLTRYIDLCRTSGGAKVRSFADGLAAVAELTTPLERYQAVRNLFFSGSSGKPLAMSGFFSAPLRKAAPDLEDKMQAAYDAVLSLADRLALLHMLEATQAALVLAERLTQDYEDIKKSRSQLDFDDLINRTARLLTRSDVGAWVHYKLDQGIDHILVDEAQDTSPVQWSIIRSLAEDFFTGDSARGRHRTLFAVGDEKQSIYSFQGARPERFSEEEREARRRIDASGLAFSPVRLQLSFRSTEDVLSAVDSVFREPAHARGLSARNEPVVHASNRVGHPGLVEIWDAIAPAPSLEEEDWTAAFDATPENAPANILAERIAATLASWIGTETIIEKNTRRVMRPGDVIVLVRKRDAFVNALMRALKTRHDIPVAGADRLVLTAHIAVQDLMALGRFLLLPQDDLSLAALLKSPLFAVTEEILADAATLRPLGQSLWHALAASDVPTLKPVVARLTTYRMLADTLSVHDLYARLLGADGGRAAFLSRLGSEVSDILDEFLTFCLDHEANGLPGLQSFISGLELEAPTIKREQDKERNEVRVMTVHAAKGLEAPVVFLVDGSGKAFNNQHVPALRMVPSPRGRSSDGETLTVPVWRPPRAPSNSLIDSDTQRLKASAEEEYRRLLYVGMTRAADRLIVCGYRGKLDNPESWHAMVKAGLAADAEGRLMPADFSVGELQWSGARWQALTKRTDLDIEAVTRETAADAVGDLPPALLEPLPPQRHLPRPLSPSGAGFTVEADAADTTMGSRLFPDDRRTGPSLLRGAVLHRLLQVLPARPQQNRESDAALYLSRAVPGWSDKQRSDIVHSVLAVIEDPALSVLFSASSRAEVSIMGTLRLGARDHAVSGRIDRLAVADNAVVIADFKTNRTVPDDVGAVPLVYRTQLAIYREILRPLYPSHRFRCILVFTEGPRVIEVPDALLDAALVDLATK
ncbi:ATP-dependent DNA helicase [Rhizobium sp. Leaf384]|uniref:double-strand break repair helicase AddA n=1 Tax=unclassified Rhizobium TaxID=2613769 RepID=UPI0007145249|nr:MULTISPECIES: double-strand break repair helicase AddA [unclassified Rhizobium]KQS76083.1 ATP-dependent DNA helicase [Rhizobium sp. Leaf384]KQS85828.1 ATP-dependent DNA helicase [Rhizobium sp. Leaf383]